MVRAVGGRRGGGRGAYIYRGSCLFLAVFYWFFYSVFCILYSVFFYFSFSFYFYFYFRPLFLISLCSMFCLCPLFFIFYLICPLTEEETRWEKEKKKQEKTRQKQEKSLQRARDPFCPFPSRTSAIHTLAPHPLTLSVCLSVGRPPPTAHPSPPNPTQPNPTSHTHHSPTHHSHSPLTTHSQPTTHHPSPTTHHPPPTTHHPPPTTHHPPLTLTTHSSKQDDGDDEE